MTASPQSSTPFIGTPLLRVEDRAFLTGSGQFTADLTAPGQLHATIVRAPHAHADILSIDTADAEAVAGVQAIYTAADLKAAGIIAMPTSADVPLPGGDTVQPIVDAPQYPLADGRVRYVGEAVAFVVADSEAAAIEAAERVDVDYAPLPAVANPEEALAAGAPVVAPAADSNRSFVWAAGNADATARAFDDAAHIVQADLAFPRSTIAFMEPRGAVAEFSDGRYTLQAGCQSGHVIKGLLAGCLQADPSQIHVIVPDTGGGFGARNVMYPEFIVALFAARTLNRPVRWIATRSEAFLTDTQARSQNLTARMALDADGRITAIDLSTIHWHGAYWMNRGAHILVGWMAPMVCGPYRIPTHRFTLTGVFTNTAPIAAYRGVARAEAILALERLMDLAARQVGLDKVELRRRNLIARDAMPWTSATGVTYQDNDFFGNLNAGLAAFDWEGYEARASRSAANGRRRGRAVTTYVENAGGALMEFADISIEAGERTGDELGGRVVALVGSQDFGMGHATMYSQIMADVLGVRPDQVDVTDGDTDRIKEGYGAHGSRTARIGGGAVFNGARSIIEAGKPLAADLLEAAEADLTYDSGAYRVAGTDRKVSLFAVAAAAQDRGAPLHIEERFEVPGMSYPSGCHLCEVEVDPETGKVSLDRYLIISDPGTVINPMLASGQLHGGIAMGVGQALMENTVYEPESGQLLSGSLMDFCLPRADDLPMVDVAFRPVEGDDNPLGVKGIAEGPTAASPPTVINAVLDALASDGVTMLDMPLTPMAVWQGLNDALTRQPGARAGG